MSRAPACEQGPVLPATRSTCSSKCRAQGGRGRATRQQWRAFQTRGNWTGLGELESISNQGQIGRRSAQFVGWPRRPQFAITEDKGGERAAPAAEEGEAFKASPRFERLSQFTSAECMTDGLFAEHRSWPPGSPSCMIRSPAAGRSPRPCVFNATWGSPAPPPRRSPPPATWIIR